MRSALVINFCTHIAQMLSGIILASLDTLLKCMGGAVALCLVRWSPDRTARI